MFKIRQESIGRIKPDSSYFPYLFNKNNDHLLGSTGPTGTRGLDGIRGFTGSIGPTGPRGLSGSGGGGSLPEIEYIQNDSDNLSLSGTSIIRTNHHISLNLADTTEGTHKHVILDSDYRGTIYLNIGGSNLYINSSNPKNLIYTDSGWKSLDKSTSVFPVGTKNDVALSYNITSSSLSSNGQILMLGNKLQNQVHVYNLDGNKEYQETQIISQTLNDPFFGSTVDISSNGDVLAVAGIEDNPTGPNNLPSGAVWIYKYTGTWIENVKLTITNNNSTNSTLNGQSLSLSGDGNTLAIGCPGDVSTNGGGGLVLIYKNTGTWNKTDEIGVNVSTNFGNLVKLSKNAQQMVVTDDSHIYLFNLATDAFNNKEWRLKSTKNVGENIKDLEVNDNFETLVYTTASSTVHICKYFENDYLEINNFSNITNCSVSSDGNKVILGDITTFYLAIYELTNTNLELLYSDKSGRGRPDIGIITTDATFKNIVSYGNRIQKGFVSYT